MSTANTQTQNSLPVGFPGLIMTIALGIHLEELAASDLSNSAMLRPQLLSSSR